MVAAHTIVTQTSTTDNETEASTADHGASRLEKLLSLEMGTMVEPTAME